MFVALTGGLLNPPHLVFHSRRDPQKSRCDDSSELANYVYGCYSTTLLAFHVQRDGRMRERRREKERERETRFGAVEPLCSFGPREWLTAQVKRQACCL